MNTTATTATTTTTTSPSTERRGLNVGLWIVQGLLAAAFLAAGIMKMVTPMEQLTNTMPWMEGVFGSYVRYIGLAEVLGGIGLVAPTAMRIKPQLTPLAAFGLLTIMILAVATHLARGEFAALAPPLVLGVLAAFVVWGRTKALPIKER